MATSGGCSSHDSDSSCCCWLCSSPSFARSLGWFRAVWPDWANFESSRRQNFEQKSPYDRQLFGQFLKASLLPLYKLLLLLFGQRLETFGLLFTSVSGHTGWKQRLDTDDYNDKAFDGDFLFPSLSLSLSLSLGTDTIQRFSVLINSAKYFFEGCCLPETLFIFQVDQFPASFC